MNIVLQRESGTKLIPMSEPILEEQVPVERVLSRSTLAAAFVSMFVPGLGLWWLGRRKTAVVMFSSFAAVASLFWCVRPAVSYWAWIVAYLGVLLLYIVSTSVTLALKPKPPVVRASRWWLALLVPVAFLVGGMICNLLQAVAGIHAYQTVNDSMEPTVHKDESFLVDTMVYKSVSPKSGDIIVFHHNDVVLIKRVIAVANHSISGAEGKLFVDGVPLNEPYVSHRMGGLPEEDNFGPIRIPEGTIFVAGDNRDLSLDSRSSEYGPVTLKDVVGRAMFLLSPRGRAGQALY